MFILKVVVNVLFNATYSNSWCEFKNDLEW